MKKYAVILLILALPAFGQDLVSEARANLEAKHHKAMVAKTEKLIERKKELESELADVNEKLEKLANGIDVKMPDAATCLSCMTFTGTASGPYPVTNCGINTCTGQIQ